MVNYILESLGIHYCAEVSSLVSKSDQLENLRLGGLPLTCSKGSDSPFPGNTGTLGKASFEGLFLKLELELHSPGGLIKPQTAGMPGWLQLVECLALNFISGHVLKICGIEPHIGYVLTA